MNLTSANAHRHAYLIICQNNFEQLCLLLELLDSNVDAEIVNLIYEHVKKRSE